MMADGLIVVAMEWYKKDTANGYGSQFRLVLQPVINFDSVQFLVVRFIQNCDKIKVPNSKKKKNYFS